jgi:2,3-bisphosphoglycerate-independent phosphoglycerate mutase
VKALEESYAADVTDEFVEPVVMVDPDGQPLAPIRDGDSVLWLNFRADRARQLTSALKDPDFEGFDRKRWPQIWLTTLTDYGVNCAVDGVAFPSQVVHQHLGRVISDAGLRQRRIAETEKYAHVTWFFSGGVEAELPGETRCLVASPKVATYDLQPEMSAEAVADETVAAVRDGDHALLVVNFANPDMVGHTGDIPAAVAALEATDKGVGRIVDAVLERGGGAFITADHGNVEQMLDVHSGKPHTAHTTNPVEAIVVASGLEQMSLRQSDARLADIAPTILDLMGLGAPAAMTGRSLLSTGE